MIRPLAAVILAACCCAAVAAAQPSRRALPLPDVDGFQPLRADLHLHSVFSDGEVWPTVHVREAWRDGLDVVALSEHREYRPHAADLSGGSRRAHEVAADVAAQLGILVVPAVEITRPAPGSPSDWPAGSAHFNALFVTDEGPLDAADLAQALDTARAQGAFVFWNHPLFMGRRAEWYAHVDAVFRRGLFTGIEVVNGDEYSPEAFGWALEHGLTVLASSDAHLPMPAHLRSERRPVTILFTKGRDLAAVREALVERRTVAWLDDQLWGGEAWLRGLWAGSVRTPDRVRVTAGREFAVAVENVSALDFDVEVASPVAWLTVTSTRLPRQATAIMRGRVHAEAPAGALEIALDVRVTNMHPAPGATLRASLPVRLTVTR